MLSFQGEGEIGDAFCKWVKIWKPLNFSRWVFAIW